jgi:succinate-semialdehyde dehydrogenase / glutarate-semialdehyde dehydrogenase
MDLTSYIQPNFLRAKKKSSSIQEKEVEVAIQKAHLALNAWKNTSPFKRAEILHAIANSLAEEKEQFAQMMTLEMGKTIRESRTEVDYSIGFFRHFASECTRFFGYMVAPHVPNKELRVYYEPVGVAGIISTWNFPLAMAARKISAALAAGCSLVVKPSPETPGTLLLFAKILQKLPLPEGLVSILIGDEEMIGKKMLASDLVRKISFTGSTKVGKYLYEKSAATLKKLTLELGGQAPLIVFEDANLEKAADELIIAKLRNSGQSCIAANRILVQKKIYPKFLELLAAKMKALKVGDPFLESTDVSSILHPISKKRVQVHIQDASKKGAKILLRGKTAAHPCLIADCTPKMALFQEETFGPVLGVSSFKTEEEAIQIANHTPFGLAAYVFTQNPSRARRVTSQLAFGIIGLNDGIPSTAQVPFGGVKHSGFGREGGPSGILEYLTEKLVSEKFTL